MTEYKIVPVEATSEMIGPADPDTTLRGEVTNWSTQLGVELADWGWQWKARAKAAEARAEDMRVALEWLADPAKYDITVTAIARATLALKENDDD